MLSSEFDPRSFIDSLQIEFNASREYIHSVRKVKDNNSNRIEPYEPSMFIYSFFTFNSLYNINWKKTQNENFKYIIHHEGISERNRIKKYLSFIWLNHIGNPAIEFNRTFIQVIMQYLNAKGKSANSIEWIKENMADFVYLPDIQNDNSNEFDEQTVVKFTNILLSSLENRYLDFKSICDITDLIYSVRCNLFHGAKDPEFFEKTHQMERFVIYAAVLTAVNQMYFNVTKHLFTK